MTANALERNRMSSQSREFNKTRWITGLSCLLALGVCGAFAVGTAPVKAEQDSEDALAGTKCWVLDPVVGKGSFMTLTFLPLSDEQAIFSGQIVRTDGKKPDRVLQVLGSAGTHTFVGDGGVQIDRILFNLNYAFSKTGTKPARAFAETGAALRGQYAMRINPVDGSGVFQGNDFVIDWKPPLTGPSATYTADNPANGYSGIANNYLGGIRCDGSLGFGFDNCGTVIPLNNAGTLRLAGSDAQACAQANPFN